MITLHQYPAAFNLKSLSPFCLKVEFFLRLAKLPYEIKVERNPKMGPKGKMPFIEDNEDVIADSSFIIDSLIHRHGLYELGLKSKENEAIALGLKTMIEEGLYFVLLYSRWVDEDGFKTIVREFSPLFPPYCGRPILAYLRASLRRQAMAQGIGRHSREEVYSIGQNQLKALASYLGDREYFFEDRLTVFDATCYAFLSTILRQPIESPLKGQLLREANLCNYIQRLDVLMGEL